MPEITTKPEFDYFELTAKGITEGKKNPKPHKMPPPIEAFSFIDEKGTKSQNTYNMVFLRKGDNKNPSEHDLLVIFDNNHNFQGVLIGERTTKFYGGSLPFNAKDGGMFLDATAIADSSGKTHTIPPTEIGFILTNTVRMAGVRDDYSSEMQSMINKIQGINRSNILEQNPVNITISTPGKPSKLSDLCLDCHDVSEISPPILAQQKALPLTNGRR